MDNVLELYDVSKRYSDTLALKNLTISLPKGKIIGLLGPNGSGKTTLIKILAGLLKPTTGTVKVCGYDIGPESKALVSYLPERTYINKSMRIKECLDFFCEFYKDFNRTRAENMLYTLGIDQQRKFATLSKGMKEKVQLALVMSRMASLYLLDEPIGVVDPATREYIINTILTRNPKATVLISTHLIMDVESILDEFMFISHGQVVRYDSRQNVLDEGYTLDSLFREVFRCF